MTESASANQTERAEADLTIEATLSERLDLITRLARRLFRTPVALVSLLEGNVLRLAACQGLPVSALGREIGLDRRTLANGGPLIVADTHADARFSSHPFVTGRPWVRFYAGCLILAADGTVAGVLSVCDREPNVLALGDLMWLRDLARLAETELRLAALGHSREQLAAERERLRRNALQDTVTHLWNRHAMFELLDREFHRARREREHVAVLLIALDGYDAVADRYGEAAARALLNEAALLVRSVARRSDTVARFGAAEFLVFLGRCEIGPATQLAERLQHRAHKTPLTFDGAEVRMDLAIGLAAGGPEAEWTPDGLVRNAEEALRAAREVPFGLRIAAR